MNFYQAINKWANAKPTNYNNYIGRSYKYGTKEMKIIGIYNDDYFEFDDGKCRHIKSFLEDVADGVYERI